MLYEKLLHEQALQIVNEITDSTVKAKWRTAASKLRLPYWDWALKTPSGEHNMPTSIADDTLRITYPNNTVKTIPNPLRKYTFHPLIPSDFAEPGEELYYPYDKWTSTLRNPTFPDNDVNARDNKTEMHMIFDEQRDSRARGVYRVMSQWQGWNNFSTAAYTNPRSPLQIGDLETQHGPGHTSFMNGHMGPSAYTAFDPVFWLHHANVDRYYAIWQAVYPTTWMIRDINSQQGTFTLDAINTATDGNTPLTPFHSDNTGGFWTPNKVRNISQLGYTYPELQGNPSNDTIKARIKANWGNTPALPTTFSKRDDGQKTSKDYITLVTLPPGYAVKVTIGKTDPTLAGVFSTKFSQIKKATTGIVQLGPALAEKARSGKLGETDEESVIAYLKKEFTFTVKNNVSSNLVMCTRVLH